MYLALKLLISITVYDKNKTLKYWKVKIKFHVFRLVA
jgi:hypothetical protein